MKKALVTHAQLVPSCLIMRTVQEISPLTFQVNIITITIHHRRLCKLHLKLCYLNLIEFDQSSKHFDKSKAENTNLLYKNHTIL